MSTFLVTGVSGFLGSALASDLLNDGHRVIGLAKQEGSFLQDGIKKSKKFRFVKFDLTKNFNKLLCNVSVDFIFHLASQQPSSKNLSYADYYAGNVETARNVINFVKSNKVKGIVFTSTVALMEKMQRGMPLNENSNVMPDNYYALTKYIAERLLAVEIGCLDTKLITLRLPSLFGRNHLGGIVHTYYTLAKNNKNIQVYNNGKTMRNLLHVSDVVKLLKRMPAAFARLSKNEVFLIGSKNSLASIKIAQKIKQLLDSSSRIIRLIDKFGFGEDILIDFSKARKAFDFNPITIESGLQKFIKEMGREI